MEIVTVIVLIFILITLICIHKTLCEFQSVVLYEMDDLNKRAKNIETMVRVMYQEGNLITREIK